MRIAVALTIISLSSFAANAQAPEDVARSFGYAIQAMGWCDGVLVRADTEDRLEAELGQSMRGDGAALSDDYRAGLDRFFEDQSTHGDDEACAMAFERVGPEGTEYPGLLIESPWK